MNDWELFAQLEQRVTVRPSAEDVADRPIRALQNGDVAVVLTRRQLDLLIDKMTHLWESDEEFKLLQDLKKLRDAHL